MKLWIDVTDTFFTWSGTPSGIQRTLLGLAAASAGSQDCRLCIWDKPHGLWRAIPAEALLQRSQSLEAKRQDNVGVTTKVKWLIDFVYLHARQAARGGLNAVRSKQTIDMWEKHGSFRVPLSLPKHRFREFVLQRRSVAKDVISASTSISSLPAIDFSQDPSATVFADSHWNWCGILKSFQSQRGKPLALGFGYDVIPLDHPHFVGARSTKDFSMWVREMQYCCDQILCISRYSAERFRACFTVGDPSPPVRSVRFGNELNVSPTIANSRKSLRELLAFSNARCSYISDHAASAKDWYLWVGSLDVRKNLDVLLLAAEGLARRDAISRPIVVVGRPSMGHAYYLHKIANHPQLREFVVHVESAEDDLLNELWQQTALFLFTSWAEGYGLPVAEALQMGIPVVASNSTSIPEVAGDLVDYFEPWNSGQLSALLERFETDPAYRQDLKARAARFVPTKWEETIEDIISGLPRMAS